MGSQLPQTRTHKVFKILSTIAVVGLILVVPAYILSARNYASHISFLSQNNHSLNIVTARGENITLSVQIDGGIDGHWASDQGLSLSLDGLTTPLRVVGSKTRDWGDTISTTMDKSDQSFTVGGTVAIPASIAGPEQRQISGTLSGAIIYPEGGFAFQEKTADVDVPIHILLKPSGTAAWEDGQLLFEVASAVEMLLGIMLLFIVGWRFVRALLMKKVPVVSKAGAVTKHNIKDDLWAYGGILFISILCAALLFGLLMMFTSIGLTGAMPATIMTSNLLLPCIVGVCILLSILTAIIRDTKQPKKTVNKVPARA